MDSRSIKMIKEKIKDAVGLTTSLTLPLDLVILSKEECLDGGSIIMGGCE